MARSLWIGLLLLGAAWALRLPFLTFHSIWLDEAVAIWIAQLPLPTLLERTMAFKEEASPPLYFLLLKGWMALAGDTEFVVRFFSAWWMAFGLAWLWHLGTLVSRKSNRLIALALGASQPYLIWFAQEARVYGLLFALSAMSGVWLLRALRKDCLRYWLLYALTLAAACYVHLTTVFLAIAHLGLTVALRRPLWSTRGGRGTMAFLMLAGLPLAWQAWNGQQGAILWWNPPLPPLKALQQLLTAWTVYQASNPRLALLGALYGGLILILGAWKERPVRASLLGLMLGIAFRYLASQRFPLTSPRYWMSLTPLALAGLAAGIGHPTWRIWALAGWIGLAMAGFQDLWSPMSAKEDWRGAAGWVAAHSGSHDVALFFAEYIRFPFFYYYRKPLDHSAFAHPIPDPARAEETLLRLPIEGHDTLWYIRAHADWADPLDLMDQTLRARYPVRMEVFPEKIRIRAYALQWTRPSLPQEARPVTHRFASGWELVGFQHAGKSGVAPHRWGVFPPTRQFHLTLYWRRLPDADVNAQLRVVLIHPDGIFQIEGAPPRGGVLERYPLSSWPSDAVVVDDRDFLLPADIPPGRYRLILTVGRPDGLAESLTLDVIEVRR